MRRLMISVFTAMLACSMNLSAGLIPVTMPGMSERIVFDHYRESVWNFNCNESGIRPVEMFSFIANKSKNRYGLKVEPADMHVRKFDRKTYNADNDLYVVTSDKKDFTVKYPVVNFKFAFNIGNMHYIAFKSANSRKHPGFSAGSHFINPRINPETAAATQSVPEPSMISLLGIGLVSLPFLRRKKI